MQLQTKSNSTPATAIARDIKAEMVLFMRYRADGCTRDDLLQEFTPGQIDQYSAAAAREATRLAERRVA